MSTASRDLMAPPPQPVAGPKLRALGWPMALLPDGIAELGRRNGLAPVAIDPGLVPGMVDDRVDGELDRYMQWLADASGMAADAVESPASALAGMLLGSTPSIVRLPVEGAPLFILLLRASGRRLVALAPGGVPHSFAVSELVDALLARHERPLRREVARVLSILPPGTADHETRLQAITRARLGNKPVDGVWSLRHSEAAPLHAALRQLRLHWLALGLGMAFAVSYLVEISGWRLIGETILSGSFDHGWLLAWALLLLSAAPLRLWGGRLNARLTVALSGLIKQRLLAGALAIDSAKLRLAGTGQILAQALETQAFEALAVNGGFAAVIALIEIAIAGYILSLGAAAGFLVPLLTAWIAMIAILGYRYHRHLARWSGKRLGLTHDMVDRMVGHRTVLAQEPPTRRDRITDLALKQYHLAARDLDGAVLPFMAGLPAGWTLAALAALAPSFIAGQMTPQGLAVAIGGILFAGRAINTICGGIAGLARAAVAWNKAAPLLRAAGRPRQATPFIPSPSTGRAAPSHEPVIDAQELRFSHDGAAQAVIEGASLTLRPGDRMLLEGQSGGGKSTFASLLSGLRAPDSGLLLLNGLDRHTLGAAWHRLATSAPQFHENHIFSGPLAYNLLMGRNWPAKPADLAEARATCEELGLGPLLDRMPAGLMQQVGEGGWQLSHGEKSRIFLARALLQGAALTILDESFAALDPETLKRSVTCAAQRAQTLLVVAHP